MKNEVNEIVKPIILTDTETKEKFTLEFNRESVYFAEGRGFNIDDVARIPMTKIHELFYYAFRMHHKNVSRQKTNCRVKPPLRRIWAVAQSILCCSSSTSWKMALLMRWST